MSARGALELGEKLHVITFEEEGEFTHNDVYASGKVLAKWKFTLQNAATKKYGITAVMGKLFAELKTTDALKAAQMIMEISDDDISYSTLFGTLSSTSLTFEGVSDLENSILERATTTGFSEAYIKLTLYVASTPATVTARNIDFKYLVMLRKGDTFQRVI